MNKKYLIFGMIAVIAVAAIAWYLLSTAGSKKAPTVTSTTNATGLSSVLANVDTGAAMGAIMKGIGV